MGNSPKTGRDDEQEVVTCSNCAASREEAAALKKTKVTRLLKNLLPFMPHISFGDHDYTYGDFLRVADGRIAQMKAERDASRALVAVKDKALDFYADKTNHYFDAKRDCECGIGGGRDCYCSPPIDNEDGEIARIALALTEKEMMGCGVVTDC